MEERNEIETRLEAAENLKPQMAKAPEGTAASGTVEYENRIAFLNDTIRYLERQARGRDGEIKQQARVIEGLKHTITRLERTIIENAMLMGDQTARLEDMRREYAPDDGCGDYDACDI